jgi:hypothetical protein
MLYNNSCAGGEEEEMEGGIETYPLRVTLPEQLCGRDTLSAVVARQ